MANLSSKERDELFEKADAIRNLFQPDIGKRVNTPIIGSIAVNPVTGSAYDLKKKKKLGHVRDLNL